ncbi:hypothetical protein BDR05DRAFT_952302 [Suillus weaverae]|nr:hypothetical protein BDR05DRAFT_952302 [Suillus weaverae]
MGYDRSPPWDFTYEQASILSNALLMDLQNQSSVLTTILKILSILFFSLWNDVIFEPNHNVDRLKNSFSVVAFSTQSALRPIYGTPSAGRKTKIKRMIAMVKRCSKHKSKYLALSNEEQVELLTKFTEWKEKKKTGVHITAKSKINNITQTLKAVENEACVAFATEGVDNFMDTVMGINNQDLVSKMEGFVVQGMKGSATNHQKCFAIGGPASTAQKVFGFANMANIFEFATSCLLAIRMTLDKSNLVTSSKVQYILTRYLMWEGDVFISPWVNYCEGQGISPPLSRNLQFFVHMLSMSQMELLNYQEFYDSFMKLPASPSGAWVTGCIIKTYPMAWWHEAFDTTDYQTFTTNLPNFSDIKEMLESHLEQLPEGWLLVTPATLVDPRLTLVTQQLANIHASMEQEVEHIVSLLENKIVEVQLVAASLLRMETALGQDMRAAMATTEHLVKYLKREGE